MRKIYIVFLFLCICIESISVNTCQAQSTVYISGTKTWNTANTNWGAASGGPYSSLWVNGNYATLETSPVITINGFNPRVYKLNNTTSGTVSSNSSEVLYLSGINSPGIDVSNAQTFAIKSILDGGLGFTKTSAGTLTLNQLSNRFHGTVNVVAGTINFPDLANIASAALRHNVVNLSPGATITYSGSTNANSIQLGTLTGAGTISTTGSAANGISSFVTQSGTSSAVLSTGSSGTITFQGIGSYTDTLTGNTTGCKNFALCGNHLVNNSYSGNVILSSANTTFTGSSANTINILGGQFTIDNTTTNITPFSTANTAGIMNLNGASSFYIKGNKAGTNIYIGTDGITSLTGQGNHAIFSNSGVSTITIETPAGATGKTQLYIGNTSNATNDYLRDQTYMGLNYVAVNGTLGGNGATDPHIFYTGSPPISNDDSLLSGTGLQGGVNLTIGWAVVNGNSWATYNSTVGIKTIASKITNARTAANLQGNPGVTIDYAPLSAQTLAQSFALEAIRILPNGGTILRLNSFTLTCNAFMLIGPTSFTIDGSVAGSTLTNSATMCFWVTDSTASLTTNASVNSTTNPLNKLGPGFLVFNGSSGQVVASGSINRFNILQGTVRLGNTQLRLDGSNGSNYSVAFKGGVLEITGGTNGTGASADFRRSLGDNSLTNSVNKTDGTVYWDQTSIDAGSGGFSAFGANASVNIGVGSSGGNPIPGGATPANLIWGSTTNFIGNGYSLIFGSWQSNDTLTFLNPLGLDNGTAGPYYAREIYVYDNTSSPNDATKLAGVISGSANADLVKTGAGELILNAANTYAGNTIIQAGTLTVSSAGTLPATTHVILLGGTLLLRAAQTITDLTLNTGATLNLNGNTLTVTGDFIYNGGTITGTGTVIFNGTSQEYIDGQPITFSDAITVNNSNGVVMANNVTVTGKASMATGFLSINGNTLTLNGSYASSGGTLTGSATSKLIIGAAATSVPLTFTYDTAKVNNSLFSLTANGSASLANSTVPSSLYIVGGTSAIPGNITVPGTAVFTSHDSLTLQSTSTGTAYVGRNTLGLSGYITGNVTIERYIQAHRAWRLMTAPINSAQTINASWQENQFNTVPTSPINLVPGYGTEITNRIITDPTTTWFDQAVTNNPSILYMNTSHAWVAPVDTKNTNVNSQPGFMLFVRGDRTRIVKTPVFPAATTTTLRTKGGLNEGNYLVTPPVIGFAVMGNPYASEITLDSIFKYNFRTILGVSYYAWDPMLTGSQNVGTFVTYNYDSATNSYSFSLPPASPFTPGKIESSQAIALNYISTGNFSLHETDKTTAAPLVFRPVNGNSNTQSMVTFRAELWNMNPDSTLGLDDGTLDLYNSAYSDSVSWTEDSKKIGNSVEDLALKRDGYLLAIEKRKPVLQTDTIFYYIANMKQNTPYQFQFAATNFNRTGLTAILQDSYLKTSTPLSLTDTTKINFTVTPDAASQGGDRFRIIFQQADGGPLPVTYTGIKAWQQNNTIPVQWQVSSQQGIKEYEVEKSVDGKNFTVVATVNASGISVYNWVDEKPTIGENYYRIQSIANDGQIQYSQIVKVKIGTDAPAIVIYPNPIINNLIGLQFTNQPKGIYSIRLINISGQEINKATIIHNGGSAMQTIPVNQALAKGMYKLEVTGPGNGITTINILN